MNNFSYLKPTLLNACDQLTRVLDKAKAHVASGALTEAELMDARLAPDMFPFVKQVQIATDNIKGGLARITGGVPPVMADDETTLDALVARVQATKTFAESVDEAALANVTVDRVRLGWMPEGMYYEVVEYATKYVIQNTLFHVVTAYDILRMKGGQIGKSDFIGLAPKQG